MSDATPHPAGSSYEFKPSQNDTIAEAARWIGLWSWISIIAGALMALGGLAQRLAQVEASLTGLILGLVYVMVGLFFRGATKAMRSVVETRGNDIEHLLAALDRLASAFQVMVVLVAIGVTSSLILVAVALLAGGTAP